MYVHSSAYTLNWARGRTTHSTVLPSLLLFSYLPLYTLQPHIPTRWVYSTTPSVYRIVYHPGLSPPQTTHNKQRTKVFNNFDKKWHYTTRLKPKCILTNQQPVWPTPFELNSGSSLNNKRINLSCTRNSLQSFSPYIHPYFIMSHCTKFLLIVNFVHATKIIMPYNFCSRISRVVGQQFRCEMLISKCTMEK